MHLLLTPAILQFEFVLVASCGTKTEILFLEDVLGPPVLGSEMPGNAPDYFSLQWGSVITGQQIISLEKFMILFSLLSLVLM